MKSEDDVSPSRQYRFPDGDRLTLSERAEDRRWPIWVGLVVVAAFIVEVVYLLALASP